VAARQEVWSQSVMSSVPNSLVVRSLGRTAMTLRNIVQLSVIVASALAFLPGLVLAQRESLKEQIVGSWMIVSAITTRSDGSKVDTFGPSPKGLQIFERNGRTSAIITASNLPRFASGNRATGTADENNAVVRGSVAFFGPYSVNEVDHSFTFQVEGSTFPNWEGGTQKRLIAISGDELTITIPAGSGGGTGESKWKRMN
jgi:hypothetical protein